MTTQSASPKTFALDFWVCAVIFLAAAFLFIDSRDLPEKAALFPAIMLVCMMCLSLYCMVVSVIKQRKARMGAAAPQNAASPIDRKAVCIFFCMAAAYAFITPYTGFGLSSLAFLAAGTVFFGEKDKRAVAAIPLATIAFVYGFFICFLDVNIPFFPAL